MKIFDNTKSFTNERPILVRRRVNDYYEIQVKIESHPPVRELILATCQAEALDKAKAKYRYVRAEVELVPPKAEKLKLARSSTKRRRQRKPKQTE